MQNLVDLNRFDQSMKGKLGQLKATIAQFFRVSGASTQFRGVMPDIAFPTVVSQDDQGERSLDNALPWASIEAARYHSLDWPTAQLGKLRSAHDQRLVKDRAFQALYAMEEAIKQAREQKTLSLNEATRKPAKR